MSQLHWQLLTSFTVTPILTPQLFLTIVEESPMRCGETLWKGQATEAAYSTFTAKTWASADGFICLISHPWRLVLEGLNWLHDNEEQLEPLPDSLCLWNNNQTATQPKSFYCSFCTTLKVIKTYGSLLKCETNHIYTLHHGCQTQLANLWISTG